MAIFYDLPEGDYFLIIEKSDLRNIKDGFLIAGVFNSQEEIDNNSFQAGAQVGGIRYADLNGDGIINDNDKTPSDFFSVSLHETFTKGVFIGK